MRDDLIDVFKLVNGLNSGGLGKAVTVETSIGTRNNGYSQDKFTQVQKEIGRN